MRRIGTKICRKCNKEFLNTNQYFHINKSNPDGLRKVCKTCQRAYLEERKRKILNGEWTSRDPKEGINQSSVSGNYGEGNYKIKCPDLYGGKERTVEGRLIQETDVLVCIENNYGVRECFLKRDFLIDHKIEEV